MLPLPCFRALVHLDVCKIGATGELQWQQSLMAPVLHRFRLDRFNNTGDTSRAGEADEKVNLLHVELPEPQVTILVMRTKTEEERSTT